MIEKQSENCCSENGKIIKKAEGFFDVHRDKPFLKI